MTINVEEIRNRFLDNVGRVRNLVNVYTSTTSKVRGRRRAQDTDILRAAVVLLHATLEDLLRSLEELKLPMASPDMLADIPIAGTKRGARIGLRELAAFRGLTIDQLIAKSVKEHLDTSNYNHPGDVRTSLGKIGSAVQVKTGDSAELAALMSRRHWIARAWTAIRAKARDIILSSLFRARWYRVGLTPWNGPDKRSCSGFEDRKFTEIRAMKIQDKVKQVLEELPLSSLAVEIEDDTGFRVVAVVMSDEFEAMDEGDRQHMVWKKLIENLDDYEQRQVEFVHTMAPSER